MEKIIALLESMGATNVQHIVKDNESDFFTFNFNGRLASIRAIHCNDSTAALEGDVEEGEQQEVSGCVHYFLMSHITALRYYCVKCNTWIETVKEGRI